MKLPTLADIDEIRREQFRPQIIACILHNKKLLFVYKNKYKLWQLPQGGIDNNETLEEATQREMSEELGPNFGKSLTFNSVIGEDKLLFPEHAQGSRKLETDAGENFFMIGKKFFFTSLSAETTNLNIAETDFDNYKWVSYLDIMAVIKSIYQKGKQRITAEAINSLHKNDLL